MTVAIVIIIFSIVQSIFGVGLLLFGTPTLLLLGFGFEQCLWMLLPSSVAISSYQIVGKHSLIKSKKEIYQYTLPLLIIGIVVVITNSNVIDIEKIVGLFLFIIGGIRLFKKFRILLKRFIRRRFKIYCVIMGAVHGISNMGGGMLTVLMSLTHARKEVIQVNIAYVYLLFGLTQIIVLSIISDNHFSYYALMLITLSSLAYYLTTKYLMHLIDNAKYQLFITFLVLAYGAMALIH
jgi:uncharacterized protein